MALTGKNIILVDDDSIIQVMIKQILIMLNCDDYEVCKSVEDAILKCEGTTFDFVILDINFHGTMAAEYQPQKSGIDMIKYLYQKKRPVPVLVFASDIDSSSFDLFRYENNHLTICYLEKPSSQIEISKAIKNCLEIHSCKDLREVKFPLMAKSMEDLKKEIEEMKETTIKNIAENIFIEFLSTNRAKIITALGAISAGLFTYYMTILKTT